MISDHLKQRTANASPLYLKKMARKRKLQNCGKRSSKGGVNNGKSVYFDRPSAAAESSEATVRPAPLMPLHLVCDHARKRDTKEAPVGSSASRSIPEPSSAIFPLFFAHLYCSFVADGDSVEQIANVLKLQFDLEILLKRTELRTIHQRKQQVQDLLQQVEATVLRTRPNNPSRDRDRNPEQETVVYALRRDGVFIK